MTDPTEATAGLVVEGLRVATGPGRLARREDAVLFLPAWDDGAEQVLEAFTTASQDAVTDAVSTVVLEREFDVPPFACLAWPTRLTLLVFGDLEVHTDHPAIPMLSGSGSGTWVEHTLRRAVETVTVTVDPPAGAAPTDLVAGVVPAAGFALELARADSPTPTEPSPPPTVPTARVAEPDGTAASDPAEPLADEAGDAVVDARPTGDTEPPATPDPVPTGAGGAGAEDGPVAPPEPAPAGPAAGEDGDVVDELDLPPAVGTQDLDSLDAIRSAVVGEPPTTGPDPTPVSRPAQVPTERLVEPDRTGAADVGGAPLVEAATCVNGHLTPAGSSTCRTCGVAVEPGAEVMTVRRPSLGVLRLDDGAMLPLDRNYRIGRRPASDEGATAAPIDGEKISRTHLEVTLRGWDVLVADCDSTNGTWVASGSQERFRRVDPEVPVRIEPGAVIRLDQRTLTFERAVEDPRDA